MIQRTVVMQFIPEFASPAAVEAIVEHSRQVLWSIPMISKVSIGLAADEATREQWHLQLSMTFDSLEQVEAFRINPQHRSWVDGYLRPKLQAIAAWNFERSAT